MFGEKIGNSQIHAAEAGSNDVKCLFLDGALYVEYAFSHPMVGALVLMHYKALPRLQFEQFQALPEGKKAASVRASGAVVIPMSSRSLREKSPRMSNILLVMACTRETVHNGVTARFRRVSEIPSTSSSAEKVRIRNVNAGRVTPSQNDAQKTSTS